MKRIAIFLFAVSLWAQDKPKAPVPLPVTTEQIEAAKVRIAWLEQALALAQAKIATLGQYYSIDDQIRQHAEKPGAKQLTIPAIPSSTTPANPSP